MVNPDQLRAAAFTLARASAGGDSKLMLAMALNYKRELHDATRSAPIRNAIRHWLAAAAAINVSAEWRLWRARNQLRHVVQLRGHDAIALRQSLDDEERLRFAALLGGADGVPARVLLRRLSHDPSLIQAAADCFRSGAIALDNGRARARTRQRAAILAGLFFGSEIFLFEVGSMLPKLSSDSSSMLGFLGTCSLVLGYIFWPVLKAIRAEIVVSDQINSVPRVRRV